jgi:hypothetical protein
MARAEEARAGYGTAGDHWGVAASSLVRAQGAVHAGEVSTVATMTAEMLRHSEVIGYDVFVVPAMLLEAWVAERRNEPGAAEDAYRRALELAGRIGFADHVSFALIRLGSNGARARGHGPSRGALSAGAGHGRGALQVAPRRACARAARPRPRGGRRRRHRRDAV